MGVILYQADENSSQSQAMLGGQYTNTDSYSIFGMNKMFFDNNKWQSKTIMGHLFNNNTYELSEFFNEAAPTPSSTNSSADFDMTGYVLVQQFLYEWVKDIYVGGQAIYVNQTFKALNAEGQDFLNTRGIEDSQRGGLGATVSYDNRAKNEKIYPREAELVDLSINAFPTALGSDEEFLSLSLNARHYRKGFKDDDVLALQFFLRHTSEDTPDGALPALGAKNIIRGFAIGQYKARTLTAVQGEYRYQITGTRFRLAAFAGYANLSNGSAGTGSGDRDSDNGNYYSGGVGGRYTLDVKSGMDYRLDLVTTSKSEQSVYVSINQSF